MADTAARLYGPTQLGTGAVTVYTSPAATTTIVRHIIGFNANTVAVALTMSVGADAAGTRFIYQVLNPKQTFEWKGFLVLAAAETIQAYSDTAASLTLTMNGVKVT